MAFRDAIIGSMNETAVKQFALWAGLQIATDTLPSSFGTVALELCTLYMADPKLRIHLEAAKLLVHDESVPSGIRSAVFAQTESNYRLHADHAISELVKLMGPQFVDNTLSDMIESGLSHIAS